MTGDVRCHWTQDDDDDYWETDCGHHHIIEDGSPEDNEMVFCCYCGKPILGVPFSPEAGEEDDEPLFLNHYRHDDCDVQPGIEWEDRWSCACNDRCPACGSEIEPHLSVDLTNNIYSG